MKIKISTAHWLGSSNAYLRGSKKWIY